MGPLSDVRVIELAHIMAGPCCGLMLADMGADVIKIEKAPGGDDSRRFLPPDIGDESAAFLMMNRNKRGITLNMKDPDGLAVFKRLVEKADVVVENFRPGRLEEMGLSPDVLLSRNPGLVLVRISGFGQTGPYASRPALDVIVQGMGGMLSITGEPGGGPVRPGASIGDITQ